MRLFFFHICAVVMCLLGQVATAQTFHSNNPDTITINSTALHCTDTVIVYSPDGLFLETNLPTIFLLHGWGGSPQDWAANMDIQGLSNEFGFRIVCPDGFHDSWYMNKVDSTQMRWRDFFWDELWPLIDHNYGLKCDRTFIDGLSMGGHGAMNIFLDHPELMRGAGSMSGVLNLRNAGGSCVLIPPMLGVSNIEDPVCDAQSAVNRIGRIPEICGKGATEKLLVVSCGTTDKTFLPATREFESKANSLGLRVIAIYSPARHRWPYWVWMLPIHLSIFRQTFDGSSLGYTPR